MNTVAVAPMEDIVLEKVQKLLDKYGALDLLTIIRRIEKPGDERQNQMVRSCLNELLLRQELVFRNDGMITLPQ